MTSTHRRRGDRRRSRSSTRRRQRQRVLVHACKVCSKSHLAFDHIGHFGPWESDQHRAPAHGEIKEGVSARILNLARLAPCDDGSAFGGRLNSPLEQAGNTCNDRRSAARMLGSVMKHLSRHVVVSAATPTRPWILPRNVPRSWKYRWSPSRSKGRHLLRPSAAPTALGRPDGWRRVERASIRFARGDLPDCGDQRLSRTLRDRP